MDRANIIQENITSNAQQCDVIHVKELNFSLVEIRTDQILFKNENGTIIKYNLTFHEKDVFTISYKGKFENGNPFRLILPIDAALSIAKTKYNAKGEFTIGSLNPDGFAIHFVLTEANDTWAFQTTSKGNSDQIQRLIEGAILSLQFELHDKFIEISKRILSMIQSNPSILRSFRNGENLMKFMKDNLHVYETSERAIIKRI